jgi:hypothetical protein
MYRVELEGFNDGVPYEKFRCDSFPMAVEYAERMRKQHPRVRFRVISVLEDYK